MKDQGQGTRDTIRDIMRGAADMLGAVRDEVEEAVEDLRRREDVSPERAREVVRDAAHRAQDAFDEARDRLNFVPRDEFETLREEVAELRRRVAALEGHGEARRIPVEEE